MSESQWNDILKKQTIGDGAVLKKLYTIQKLIGQGTDGKIYEVVHK